MTNSKIEDEDIIMVSGINDYLEADRRVIELSKLREVCQYLKNNTSCLYCGGNAGKSCFKRHSTHIRMRWDAFEQSFEKMLRLRE